MVERKTLLRYVLSFLFVLLLPLAAFFLIYNEYFAGVYQNEVLRWYGRDVDKLNDEIAKHVSFMQYAAGQFTNQKSMKKDGLALDYPGYAGITNALSSIVYPQDFFTTLAFYSEAVPDTVFTNLGTYATDYYKQYRLEDGSWADVKTMLKTVKKGTWLIPAQIRSAGGKTSWEVEYLLPVPGTAGNFALFSIPEHSLRDLSPEYAGNTMIMTAEGEQVYPYEPRPPALMEQVAGFFGSSDASGWINLDNGVYLFISPVKGTNLVSAILLPKVQVLSRVTAMQRRFLAIFLLLLLLGGITVFFMVFLNYRPIRRLVNQAKEAVGGGSCKIGDLETVTYAIESMSRSFLNLKEEAGREKDILRLVYGRTAELEALEEGIGRLGLSSKEACYRVVVLYVKGSAEGVDALTLLGEYGELACPVAAMEYLHDSCYLAVMNGDPEGKNLRLQMNRLLCMIEKETGAAACVAAGESCESPKELPRSFRQAMRLGSQGEGVRFFEKDARNPSLFLYPSLDLHTLHRALEEGNSERAALVTDMLLDTARGYTGHSFIAISICCEVINNYLSTFRDWKLSPEEMVDVYSMYSSFYSFTDVDTLIDEAEKIKEVGIRIMGTPDPQEESRENFASSVMGYVDERLDDPNFCINMVADEFRLSTSSLSHRFKTLTGMKLSDYINERRMAYARTLLLDSRLTVSRIAMRLGYTQSSNFIRTFKAAAGMTPNEYRSGLKGGAQTDRKAAGEGERVDRKRGEK